MKTIKIILIFAAMALVSTLYTNCDSELSGLTKPSVFGELPDTEVCQNLTVEQSAIYQASTNLIPASLGLFQASSVKSAESLTGEMAIQIDNECLQEHLSEFKGSTSKLVKRFSKKMKRQAHTINFSKASKKEKKLFNKIRSLGCIQSVAKNQEYKLSSVASTFNDTRVPFQNYLDSINYVEGYEGFLNTTQGIQPDDKKIVVAVLDGGLHTTHSEFTGQLWANSNGENGINIPGLSTSEESDISDISPDSHGTHISGMIAALQNNSSGIVGVADGAVEIMTVKVFRPDGEGDVTASTSSVIDGIEWAVNNGANIINLSLSAEVSGGNTDPLFENAIANAVNQGVLVIVAAGNGVPAGRRITETGFGIIPARYGGNYQGILSVGSYDVVDDGLSFFSHYSTQHIEISAPGAFDENTGLLSTVKPSNSGIEQYKQLSGTSQSAPLVAAGAALFMSLFQKYYGVLPSPAITEMALVNSSVKDVGLSSFFKDGARLDVGELFNYSVNNFSQIAEAYGVDSSGLCF